MTEPITKEERTRALNCYNDKIFVSAASYIPNYEAALQAAEARIAKLEAALRNLSDAAERIRHWHDAMKDGSGMVVSKEHVFLLWDEIKSARAALGETDG